MARWTWSSILCPVPFVGSVLLLARAWNVAVTRRHAHTRIGQTNPPSPEDPKKGSEEDESKDVEDDDTHDEEARVLV